MTHFFLFSDRLTQERLSWIEESLKFFFMKLNPASLLHHGKNEDTVFTFLVTGDALYSFTNPETLPAWEIILSLPSVRVICDREEMDLRGISVERLKMKVPDQIVDHNSMALNGKPSFWKDVVTLARQNKQPVPSTIGFLQLESSYMHRSSLYTLRCLSAAVEAHASVDLYAYLDGIHLGHIGQSPGEFENIGLGLEELSDRAAKRGLLCQMTACARCSTARGYSTWDDGQGVIISTCTIKPFRIRELSVMIDQFRRNHVILGSNAAVFQTPKESTSSVMKTGEATGQSPSITILVTQEPYGTETVFGAVSFAVASAHQGILTRVIFIEDGVYSLYGNHNTDVDTKIFNIQDVIDAIAGTSNLQMYAHVPSLQQRNITKNKRLTAVLDIGSQELGQLLFNPSGGKSVHQRILFF
jgi:tRNA 2-thiouridine synthesizing protein C